MTLTVLLQLLVNGLSIGSVYCIVALGYTLVFSILGIINFAHGAILAVGAYFTYALMGGQFGFNGLLANSALPVQLPFPLALVLGSLLAGLVGIGVERLAFRPLRRRGADTLLTVVSSLGVALVIVNLIQYLVGAEAYTFPSNVLGSLPAALNIGTTNQPYRIRTIQVLMFGVSIAMVIVLTALIRLTLVGKAMRAVAEDPVMASLLGINVDAYIVFTFFLSSALAGVAGTLIGVSSGIAGPYFGISLGLKGLAVIVLGGLGSIPGAVVGGLTLGIVEAFVPASVNAYKDAIAFGLLLVMLLIRPQGLLGQRFVQKV
ncbi:MAG: branched-chain amino acid ABC transporter permease [Cyanobacteria bacterium]|nr:branched-chain amino acid ABC transporter permease [Cyanobacteriota bacterium]MDW8201248.1 branched-chain amino acid ABC transporter permease [Cyanobacteriota bacterium SKYGB_h_bin112]